MDASLFVSDLRCPTGSSTPMVAGISWHCEIHPWKNQRTTEDEWMEKHNCWMLHKLKPLLILINPPNPHGEGALTLILYTIDIPHSCLQKLVAPSISR